MVGEFCNTTTMLVLLIDDWFINYNYNSLYIDTRKNANTKYIIKKQPESNLQKYPTILTYPEIRTLHS